MNTLKNKELEFLIKNNLVEKIYMNDADKKKMNKKYNENFEEFTDGIVESYYFEILDPDGNDGKYDFYKWEYIDDLKNNKNIDKEIQKYIEYQNSINLSNINKNIQFFKNVLVVILVIFVINLIVLLLSL